MVAISTPMETVKHVKLYFDACALHISTPFKKDFVTLNDDYTSGTLDSIASCLTIIGTGNVKYTMFDNPGKPYTMMVEAYCVPELKHRLVLPQDIQTEEVNTMYFRTHYGFEGEDRFTKLIVKPKVKGYHR